MAIEYRTITGTITQPGSSIGISAQVIAYPTTDGYNLTFSSAGGGASMGPATTTTDPSTGAFSLTIPVNSDQQATGLQWRFIVKRLTNTPGFPATWTVGTFPVTANAELADLADLDVITLSPGTAGIAINGSDSDILDITA